jgi:hypothetical protein
VGSAVIFDIDPTYAASPLLLQPIHFHSGCRASIIARHGYYLPPTMADHCLAYAAHQCLHSPLLLLLGAYFQKFSYHIVHILPLIPDDPNAHFK